MGASAGASVLATTPSSACRGPALAPRRSSASASVLLRKNARPVIGPAGADVLTYHAFASLKRGPAAKTPALVGFRLRFASQKRAAGHRPRRGRCFDLPRFRFAQAWPRGQNPGARRLPPPFCFAKTRGRSSAPPGPMFWPTTLSLRSSVAPRPKPRRLTFYRGML